MKFLRRLRNAFAALFNRYEAAQTHSATWRSWLPSVVQDARLDATKATRVELMRKARYFEKNSAIAQRIGSVFVDYVVGPRGLLVTPASSSATWNDAAKKYWTDTAQFIDLVSRQDFGTLQGVMAWTSLFDGEIFILKTRGQSRSGQLFPRIQLIEAHRVCTPPELHAQEGLSIVDGVAIDASGRPTGYWVRDSFDDTTYRLIDAKDMIHYFEPSRPGQYRGITAFHAVLNDLHLLDDLEQLEFRAAVDAAEKSTFVKTHSGQLAPSLLGGSIPLSSFTTPVSGLSIDERERSAQLRESVGGRTFALKVGEDVSQFIPQRPSDATRYLWEYLVSKICIGIGIPKQLVIPYSIQGTVVRGDYDVANAFFKSRSAIAAAAAREVYIYAIGWGIAKNAELSDPLPPDWTNVTIRPPRAVNVDVGRNSAAMLAELKSGATNYELIYAPLGLDWREEVTKLADQIKFIHELAAARGIEPTEISELAGAAAASGETGGAPDLKSALDAYGVAVRAGAITPTPDDEKFFREKAGLPPISSEAIKAWSDEDNVRRPITLTPPDGAEPIRQPAPDEDAEPQPA